MIGRALLIAGICVGCATQSPPGTDAQDTPGPRHGGPDAALFLETALALVPGLDPSDDENHIFRTAMDENDFDGPHFAAALDLLNAAMENAGYRPLRRPLPAETGKSHGP